jgi:hypothetical protein
MKGNKPLGSFHMRIIQIKNRGLGLLEKFINGPSVTIFGKERGDSDAIFVIFLSQYVISKRALFLHIFQCYLKTMSTQFRKFLPKSHL